MRAVSFSSGSDATTEILLDLECGVKLVVENNGNTDQDQLANQGSSQTNNNPASVWSSSTVPSVFLLFILISV